MNTEAPKLKIDPDRGPLPLGGWRWEIGKTKPRTIYRMYIANRFWVIQPLYNIYHMPVSNFVVFATRQLNSLLHVYTQKLI